MSNDYKILVQNVLKNEDAKKYLKLLVNRSGALERTVNLNNPNEEYYKRGKKELGLIILEDVLNYSTNDYKEFIRKD